MQAYFNNQGITEIVQYINVYIAVDNYFIIIKT